ncbi:MAG TPA: DUF3298 domain-containing protein [Pyrinomonadaceae bacterium]|nr:DUF3298 domain-containing protein [Pyrinomonadaceae bacterium]
MKRFFPTIISIALVLGGAGAGVPARAVSQAAQRSSAAVKFVPRQIRQASRRLRYTVKAKYPQAVGAARDARLARLNQELRKLTVEQVGGFTEDFAAPEERMGAAGSYFESEYTVTLATQDLVSVWFGVSSYYEGAAHPNHNALTFNYDLRTGKQLKLADLFKPNSDYLKVISDYAIKDLTGQIRGEMSGDDPDTDWIREGAGPKEENYQSWNLSPKGLEINFDPYQVASYAAGPHEVVIPLSALQDVLDPDGPLGRMQN